MAKAKATKSKVLSPAEKFQAMNRLIDYFKRVVDDKAGKFESREELLKALKRDLGFEVSLNNLVTLAKTVSETEPEFSVDSICNRTASGFYWIKQRFDQQAEEIRQLQSTTDKQAAAFQMQQQAIDMLTRELQSIKQSLQPEKSEPREVVAATRNGSY